MSLLILSCRVMSLLAQDNVIVYFRVGKPQIGPKFIKICPRIL